MKRISFFNIKTHPETNTKNFHKQKPLAINQGFELRLKNSYKFITT